jgi:hypothetical protein
MSYIPNLAAVYARLPCAKNWPLPRERRNATAWERLDGMVKAQRAYLDLYFEQWQAASGEARAEAREILRAGIANFQKIEPLHREMQRLLFEAGVERQMKREGVWWLRPGASAANDGRMSR